MARMALWSRIRNPLLVACYVGAAVAANLAVATWGQPALVVTAFLLVPFDLVARDVLHESWGGRGVLFSRMAALVLAGSAVSALVNVEATNIAVASAVAFALAGVVDAGVFGAMESRQRWLRMNVSNIFSAVTDSIVFPLVAFAAFNPGLSASQAVMKIAGGVLWSALFTWRKR